LFVVFLTLFGANKALFVTLLTLFGANKALFAALARATPFAVSRFA
jgi:hypothetical protein